MQENGVLPWLHSCCSWFRRKWAPRGWLWGRFSDKKVFPQFFHCARVGLHRKHLRQKLRTGIKKNGFSLARLRGGKKTRPKVGIGGGPLSYDNPETVSGDNGCQGYSTFKCTQNHDLRSAHMKYPCIILRFSCLQSPLINVQLCWWMFPIRQVAAKSMERWWTALIEH